MHPGTATGELYYKIKNMLHSSTEFLRQLFKARWRAKSEKDWEETEEQGNRLLVDLLKTTPLNKDSMARIESGCLDNWDLSTLSTVLRKHEFMKQVQFKQENEAIFILSVMRNTLSHFAIDRACEQVYQCFE